MTETNRCPKCGAELPAIVPSGICPKCLMAAGMASDTELHSNQPEGEPTTPFPNSSNFVPPKPSELAEHFPQLSLRVLGGAAGFVSGSWIGWLP